METINGIDKLYKFIGQIVLLNSNYKIGACSYPQQDLKDSNKYYITLGKDEIFGYCYQL